MDSIRLPRIHNSTNGRLFTLRRCALALAAKLAPETAEDAIIKAFFSPKPRIPAPLPSVPGIPQRRFEIRDRVDPMVAWEWGFESSTRPTVLLVHGWNGDAAQMARLVPPLVERGFHVVAIDLPGHGASPLTGGRLTLTDMADAVLEVARLLAPIHALVAHSLGAGAAILAIENGLKVDRVVLLAPPAEPTYYARGFARLLGLPESRMVSYIARMEAQTGKQMADLDLVRFASGLDIPVMLFHDPWDAEVPFAHGYAIAQAWKGSKIISTWKLGHHRILRDETVKAQIAEFLTPPVDAKGAQAGAYTAVQKASR